MMRALALALLLSAAPLAAQTNPTGDRIDGIAVIDRLDASDLSAGAVHRFWFRVAPTASGGTFHVPVIVIRGSRPGHRLLMTAGIHGDELNGIDVLQQMAGAIDPATLSGTLVMVPGLNAPGLLHRTRGFTPRGGTGGDNLNRAMPGTVTPGASDTDRYAHALWHGLLRPNADTAIDLHTQSAGTAYVYYAFAEAGRPAEIAAIVAPDIIKIDSGEAGTVENEMVRDGVPAITLEIGHPLIFDAAMNARAMMSIRRVMAHLGMIDGAGMEGNPDETFTANKQDVVRTQRGGWARLLVGLNDAVVAGQPVATVSDAFGREIERLTAPVTGRVSTIATDPLRDPGAMLMRIAYLSDDPACARGC